MSAVDCADGAAFRRTGSEVVTDEIIRPDGRHFGCQRETRRRESKTLADLNPSLIETKRSLRI
jgi:hypothetical protein